MKPYSTLLMILCLPATLTWSQTDTTSSSAGFEQSYQGILRNNIFSRYRKPYVEPQLREQPVKAPPPPPEETYYVLRGISRANNHLVALIENNNQGMVQFYGAGSKIARGRIESITSLDGLDYVSTGPDPNQEVVTHVVVGQNLLGSISSTSSSSYNSGYNERASRRSVSSSPQSTPAPNDASTGDANSSDILKQLMERRQRELDR